MTPWTVAHQAPLSMGLPVMNTGVGCHFLLQGIFPTQGSNPGPLLCRQILYRLSHQASSIPSITPLSLPSVVLSKPRKIFESFPISHSFLFHHSPHGTHSMLKKKYEYCTYRAKKSEAVSTGSVQLLSRVRLFATP